jgi:hypothetical protein
VQLPRLAPLQRPRQCMLSLVSTFLYALLSNSVMLVHFPGLHRPVLLQRRPARARQGELADVVQRHVLRVVAVLDGGVPRRAPPAVSGDGERVPPPLPLLLAGTEEATDRRVTTRELVDECKTFFFGGHKTTVLSLSWTLLMLTAHPDWQDAFSGSGWHGPLNGPCYSDRPGTVGPTPCRAREEVWTRRAARHGTVKWPGLTVPSSNGPGRVGLGLGRAVPPVWTSIMETLVLV